MAGFRPSSGLRWTAARVRTYLHHVGDDRDSEQRTRPRKARSGRVHPAVPVRAEFAGETYFIDEFSADPVTDGLRLRGQGPAEPGTRGRLTFRVSRWDPPVTVEAEVTSVAAGGEAPDAASRIDVRLLRLTPAIEAQLGRVAAGRSRGSVTEAIREAVRGEQGNLQRELRQRTTDQKVMFAVAASGEEIDALIRDGNHAAVIRLFQNPRLTVAHVRSILKDPGLPTRVLAAVKQNPRWLATEDLRVLYCTHPATPLQDALRQLGRLSPASLRALAERKDLRAPLATRIRQLARPRPAPPAT